MRPARGHLVLRRRVSGFAVLQMVSLRGTFDFSFFGLGKRLALANRAGTHISLLLLYRTLVVRFLRALGADLAIHALAAILLLTNYDPKICIKEWRVVTKEKASCDIYLACKAIFNCLTNQLHHLFNISALPDNETETRPSDQPSPTSKKHPKNRQNPPISPSQQSVDGPTLTHHP